ncbi:PglL family O-oligosaccharyltransferase [Methylophaga thiooxydans]|uniref:PglL family O-oligosaccharyltransferase n=1 Tax=Methylophaga thiooxydans TaxID=392484 RepID=UPI002357F4FD|nr:O-antigen ligase family protein [Methylophaga thiooxydans]
MTQTHKSFFSRWSVAEIMLVILFLLAPLYYHPNLGGEGLRIPNNITVWLIALIFITFSLNKVIKAEFFQLPRYFGYLAAFPVLVILSGFLAGVEQPLSWLFRVLFILGGFAFLISLLQHKLKAGRWDRLLLIIALSGLIHAGIGLLQMWLKLDMPFLLPKSPDGIPGGLFQQINNQASYLTTCIVLAFYLASRPLTFRRLKVIQLLLALTVLTASLILGISGSRVGLLGIATALPILLLARRKQLFRNKRLSILLLVAAISGFSFGVVQSSSKVVDKTTAIHAGYSGSARLGIYNISLDLLTQEPLFGHGIGSFPRVFQYARPGFYAEHPDGKLPKQKVGHPHNELLLWMVEGGLVALLGIMVATVGMMLALIKLGVSRGWSCFAFLLPLSIHTLVELPFYMSALHWLMFILLIAASFQYSLSQRRNQMTVYAKKLSTISLLLISLLMMLALAHTIRANWDFIAFYKGQQNEKPLPVAKQNPFLAEQAQWIDMSAMLYSSMQYGLRDNVVYYVLWGEQLLKTNPDIDLYTKLLDAYEYLDNKSAYCETARKGSQLYPHSERMQQALFKCRN